MTKSPTGIRTIESLRLHLEQALAIEHATIPPYMAAWLSIQTGTNIEAAGIIRTVMLEEMLHMTLVANMLNAIGGEPRLTIPGFVGNYPCILPYSGDRFKISIEKFSRKALQTFLKIEKPSTKLAPPEAGKYRTLGQFYKAIHNGIEYLAKHLGEKKLFCGDPARQVPPGAYYGTGKFFVVNNKETALAALREIVSEGEGDNGTIFDEDPNVAGRGREPAHYYRFNEILAGRYYQKGDTPRTGPRGAKFPVDFTQVYPIHANTKLADYPPGSPIRTTLEAFSAAYGQLLAAIEDAYNGQHARMGDAIAAMFQVEKLGLQLMRTPSGRPDGSTVGLSFEQAAQTRAASLPSVDADIDRVIAAHADVFRKPGIVSVRPGWKVQDGWIKNQRAIVAIVEKKKANVPASQRIPAAVGGIVTDVREATPKHLARVRNPALLAKMQAHERPEQRSPVFPLERDAQTGRTLPPPPPPGPKPAAATGGLKSVPYTPAPGVPLDPVTAQMTLICQVSPDAGWPALKTFLGSVQNQLTVGMYDCTSAHVLATLTAGLSKKQKLSLVLDHPPINPTANQTDEETEVTLSKALGNRMQFAWAAAGDDPMVTAKIFDFNYHIKVAVKDLQSFWLSSGNWNNSNQPDINPFSNANKAATNAIIKDSDRDWHIIVNHPGLAKTFDAYLQHDLQAATALQNHKPLTDAKVITTPPAPGTGKIPVKFFPAKTFENVTVTIQPLLTPDLGAGNYASHIAAMIQSAKKSVFVQTQYLHPPAAGNPSLAPFRAIIDAIVAKINAKLDVRLIFSEFETDAFLEQVQSAGIPGSVVKIQTGVHNKGIVVDSSVVALGSQNWSNDGALFNRDASLIISDANVAQYYEQVFLHDWENMAEQKIPKPPPPGPKP
jgi:Ferritin-like/PLD-like domain